MESPTYCFRGFDYIAYISRIRYQVLKVEMKEMNVVVVFVLCRVQSQSGNGMIKSET
jgi:hypothetical protein